MSHRRSRFATLPVLATLVLAGCAGTPQHQARPNVASLYKHGLHALEAANYKAAEGYFRSLKADYPFKRYAREAALYLIYTHFMAGHNHEAANTARRFIQEHPRSPDAPYAYFMVAVAESQIPLNFVDRVFGVNPAKRNIRNLRAAFGDYKKLLVHFPASPYSLYGRFEMHRIRDRIAEHDLYIAHFLLEKGAYVASANRAAEIVRRLGMTPSVPAALKILIRDYRHLGEPALALQAQALREAMHNTHSGS
jgi:outer membrane protein assembly factor BamD